MKQNTQIRTGGAPEGFDAYLLAREAGEGAVVHGRTRRQTSGGDEVRFGLFCARPACFRVSRVGLPAL